MAQSGFDKIKDGLSQAVEPAITLAETGSEAAASWSLLQTVIMTKVLGPLSLVTGTIMAMNGAMKLFLGRTEAVAKGIEKIRRLEMLKTQFQPLLGGAASAQKKIEELFTFAATTPFQLEEIAEAARTLEVLTKGGASGADSLRMVGDAAAVSGQSMQTVSFWVGRTYDALRSGAPIGEATARLQEMGLITGDVRRKLQASAEAGESFSTSFGILKSALMEAEGGMLELSKTLVGLESTLADVRGKFAAGFAKDFAVAEKANVKTTIALLQLLQKPAEAAGQNIAVVGNAIAKAKSGVVEFASGFKTLGSTLANVVNGMFMFGAAVAAVQTVAIIQGLRGLNTMMGLSTGLTKAYSLSQMAAAVSSQGFLAATMAAIKGMAGMTFTMKIQTIVGFGLIGMFKLLKLTLGMVAGAFKAAFAVMLANPIGIIITALTTLVGIFMKASSSADAHKQALDELAKQAEETKKRLDDLVASFKTVGDVEAGTDQMRGELKTIEDQMDALVQKISEMSMIDRLFGEDNDAIEQLEVMADIHDIIRERLQAVLDTDRNTLQLGDAKIAQLQRQVSLQREIESQAHSIAMARATEVEQITLMLQRSMQLEKQLSLGLAAEESGIAFSQIQEAAAGQGDGSFPVLDNAVRGAEDAKQAISELESQIGVLDGKLADAAQSSIALRNALTLATQEDVDAGRADRVGRQFIDERKLPANFDDFDFFNERKLINDIGDAIRQMILLNQEAEEFDKLVSMLKTDAAGANLLTPEDINNLTEGKDMLTQLIALQDSLIERGAGAGVLAALKARKADNTGEDGTPIMNAQQLQILEQAIQLLEKEKENINANTTAIQQLEAERAELNAQQQHAIALLEIDIATHKAMMGVANDAVEVERKRLQIRLDAAKARQEEIAADGKVARSTDRMEAQLAKMRDDRAAMEDDSQAAKNIEKQIADLEKSIATQKKFNKEVIDAIIAIQQLEKALDDLDKKVERAFNLEVLNFKKQFEGLNFELFTQGDFTDFDKAIEAAEKRRQIEEEIARIKDRQELKAQGFNDSQIEQAMEQRQRLRDREIADKQLFQKQAINDELRVTQLETQARIFGDSNARNEAMALRAQKTFRQEMAKNIGLGMDGQTAAEFAMRKIDTDLLKATPEAKVVADSFRRIGAGGFAGGTDPMRLLAERRNKILETLMGDIRRMLNVDEKLLEKDDNIRLK